MDRLWLLSMMTMGCLACGDDVGEAEETDGTTQAASTGPSDGTTLDPGTSSGTTADDTTTGSGTTAAETTAASVTQGPSTSDTDPGGSSGESSSDTTSVEPPSEYVEACVAAYTLIIDCYGRNYTDAQILALCVASEGYFEMYYGEACLGSQLDYLACLSALTCKELTAKGGAAAGACNDEYVAGNEVCPELFTYCSGDGGAGGGPDGCGIQVSECLDGNDYAVDCDATTCTCLTNDMPGATFDSPGVDACLDDGFSDTAETECGFPSGVF